MKLVKTLSAIALIGAAVPTAHAVSIKDDVVKLGVGVRLQTRVTVADGTDTNGQEFRVQDGRPNNVNDSADFEVRRARLYLKIKYGDNWSGELAFNADKVDNEGTGSSTSGNRGLLVRYAWVERQFKMGDLVHAVHFGLDKPYNNISDVVSSSARLLPTDSAATELLAPRGVGIGYRLSHPIFKIAADLLNNTNTTKDFSGTGAQESEGFYYGARAEFSFSPEWFIAKRAESWYGQEGTGLNVGISYGTNTDAIVDDSVSASTVGDRNITTTAYGVDVLVHFHAISAFAEYRKQTVEDTPIGTGTTVADVDSDVMLAQLGYAFPLEDGTVIEPVIRYQIIDENTDVNETVNYAPDGTTAEVGNSGDQIDLGINYYLDGHGNKLMLSYQIWEAEEGNADANIIRLQHQLNF